jgi:Holliday junction DNA helicase RuvB
VRPKKFDEIYGNEDIINDLKILIKSSEKRNLPLDHILLFGPPGLGKTTIGSVISSERNVGFKPITGSNIDKKTLIEVLQSIEKLDILFIDEIHALNNDCALALFTAMEDSYIDITENGGAYRHSIPPFTVIGGTTDPGKILAPMRDRFTVKYNLKLYDNEDLMMIIGNAAKKLNIKITREAALMIAQRSRGTPRNSISLLKKARAYADVHNARYEFANGKIGPCINKAIADMVFDSIKIDENGLNEMDREYLRILHNLGTSGIKTISSAMNEADDNITEMIEPWLISQGYVKRTPRGRMLTKKGESVV